MNYRTLSRVLTASVASMLCLSAHAETLDPVGYWSGHLGFRGKNLQVRILIDAEDGRLSSRLSIPALVYANQPMPIVRDDDQFLSLELPFGLGPVNLAATDMGELTGSQDGLSLRLVRSQVPQYSSVQLNVGADEVKSEGTLYLPEGTEPAPVVVIVAGSGNANRENWSYASWVEYYLALGVGAFVYDRRPDMAPLSDGSIAGIEDHAKDVLDAIGQIRQQTGVDPDRVGISGSSRGAWIAMAVASELPDLAFLLLLSPAAVTPGEQEVTSVLTGMRQDGLGAAALAEARAYLRLYFYVAHTGEGWEILQRAIAAGSGSDWLQYVDQPRAASDLLWWRSNMNFDAIEHLQKIEVPVLALWGERDFISPWADYELKLKSALMAAGNDDVATGVFDRADHRLEIGFGENDAGEWNWFGLAPGVLEMIESFVYRTTPVGSSKFPGTPVSHPEPVGSNACGDQ